MIKKCTCKHDYQDRVHGKGNRVHTVGKKGEENCTVCGPVSSSMKRLKTHASMHVAKNHG